MQRTIRNNFLDSNKQEAIDMLLFNNAFSGELGQKTRAFLERADVFGKISHSHTPYSMSPSGSVTFQFSIHYT